MVAARDAGVEEHAVQPGLGREADVALLHQLARERGAQAFAGLDPAAGQMPAADIRMLDQEHAAMPVDHQAEGAEGHAARKPPAEMEYAAQKRFEAAAQAAKLMRPSYRARRAVTNSLVAAANYPFLLRIILI